MRYFNENSFLHEGHERVSAQMPDILECLKSKVKAGKLLHGSLFLRLQSIQKNLVAD